MLLHSCAWRDHKGPHPGGHAGVRLGEAHNPGPADHDRDSAQEEPCPRRTHVDEAGAGVPGSQDSITRGAQNLQLADVPPGQRAHTVRAPPSMPNSRRPTQQWAFDRGGKTAVIIAERTLRLGTYLWPTFSKTDDSQVNRMPLQASPTLTNPLPPHSQFREETHWMTVHFRTAQSGTLSLQSKTGSCLPNSAEPQQWPSHAAQSHDTLLCGPKALRAISSYQSWALLCRYRCRVLLAEIPMGSTETQN